MSENKQTTLACVIWFVLIGICVLLTGCASGGRKTVTPPIPTISTKRVAVSVAQPIVAKTNRMTLHWDTPDDYTGNIYELSYKTAINGQWQVLTNVVGTNSFTVLCDQPQRFYTITKVMNRYNTNIFIQRTPGI